MITGEVNSRNYFYFASIIKYHCSCAYCCAGVWVQGVRSVSVVGLRIIIEKRLQSEYIFIPRSASVILDITVPVSCEGSGEVHLCAPARFTTFDIHHVTRYVYSSIRLHVDRDLFFALQDHSKSTGYPCKESITATVFAPAPKSTSAVWNLTCPSTFSNHHWRDIPDTWSKRDRPRSNFWKEKGNITYA